MYGGLHTHTHKPLRSTIYFSLFWMYLIWYSPFGFKPPPVIVMVQLHSSLSTRLDLQSPRRHTSRLTDMVLSENSYWYKPILNVSLTIPEAGLLERQLKTNWGPAEPGLISVSRILTQYDASLPPPGFQSHGTMTQDEPFLSKLHLSAACGIDLKVTPKPWSSWCSYRKTWGPLQGKDPHLLILESIIHKLHWWFIRSLSWICMRVCACMYLWWNEICVPILFYNKLLIFLCDFFTKA